MNSYSMVAGAAVPDDGPTVRVSYGGTVLGGLLTSGTALAFVATESVPSPSFAVAEWHNESRTQPALSLEAITLAVILVVYAILRRLAA